MFSMEENNQERSEEEKELREEVDQFLMRNFPQIEMHGGTSSVVEANPEEGYVKVSLGGSCSGCGISPMTTQAIRSRMPDDIEKVSEVEVSTGSDGAGFGTLSPGFEDDGDIDDLDDLPSI
jgi:Fe-S cluster biogenesis protein NfuA